MNIIFWDTETNGLEKYHSVLSVSAIKYSISIENNRINSNILDRYERFYYRKANEAIGKEAIAVNGLTDDVIKEKRKGVNYPENFCNDINYFKLFCSDTKHFVGHNIYYDVKYINFWLANMFCTMKTNTTIIGLKRPNGKPKFPSLEETAKFYGIATDKNKLHGSMYDSSVTLQVFLKMFKNEKAKNMVIAFINKV